MGMKRLSVPTSKSQSMRALILATLAKGTSTIENVLASPDVEKMKVACQQLGATISGNQVIGRGVIDQERTLDAGNSGQVLRFGAALAALSSARTVLDGDESIRERRPIAPLIKGLQDLGVVVEGSRPPFALKGPYKKRAAHIDGQDSQPVSALIIAGAFSPYGLDLVVDHPGETPWVALTLSWLERFQIPYSRHEFSHYQLAGGAEINGFHYRVPTDFSSLAAPVTLALVRGEEVVIDDIEDDPHQGDRQFLNVVQEMGAKCIWSENRLHIIPQALNGIAIDLNPIIDMAPLLATLACFAKGKTRLYNGQIARFKESDRLAAMATELNKLGGKVREFDDGLEITPSPLGDAKLDAYQDHRIAMALAIATDGKNQIKEHPCIQKSYPGFSRLF